MYISFLKSIIVSYFFRVCQKMTATLALKLEADSGGWPGTGIKVTLQYSFMFSRFSFVNNSMVFEVIFIINILF